MKRLITILFISVLAVFTAGAQTCASADYKLQKAYEVLQEDHDEEKALGLLDEVIKECPGNAEALFLRAKVQSNRDKFDAALSDLNRAMKVNRPKKSGIYNSTLWWWKAAVYDMMGEPQQACDAYRTTLDLARKERNENIGDILWGYAQSLYDLKRYDEADAVYRDILKEDESNQPAMVGLARDMIAKGQYRQAVVLLEKAVKYDDEYSGTYQFLTDAYDKLGEVDKAIDNAVLLLDNDEDALGDDLTKVLLKHDTYSVAKLKEKLKVSEQKGLWQIALIKVYEGICDYEKALEGYNVLESEYGKDDYICERRSDCYNELGLTELALSEIDKAFEISPDGYNWASKGDILRGIGRYEEAVACYEKTIDEFPTNAYGYYARGWCYELMGDDDRAMASYEQGIDLDKSYPYIFLMRGNLYSKRGDDVKARADYETVLQLDTLADEGSCRHYALCFLGKNDEAQQWMEKIIDGNPKDFGNWYDQACLYARMGRQDDAVKALKSSLEMGYCKFSHIEHDDDMDPIRDREDFKSLIAEYAAKLQERLEKYSDTAESRKEEAISEVSISRNGGGTFEVPCTVNGLALNMIFDTGASDVSISSVEANFMLKNRYLSERDFKGKAYFQTATGEITEGTVITLKEVRIGDAVLKNVDASVVKNQKAPLLLGQSVMERFGTITIDNINSKLIIKQ